MFNCHQCSYKAGSAYNLRRHVNMLHERKRCNLCLKSFWQQDEYQNHLTSAHTQNHCIEKTASGRYKCGHCETEFETPADARAHELGKSVNTERPLLKQDPVKQIPGLSETEQKFWYFIRTHHHRCQRPQDRYNFRLSDALTSEISHNLWNLFESQRFQFKITIALGFILRDKVIGEKLYHYASHSTALAPPQLISNRNDMEKIVNEVSQRDLLEHASLFRFNSKFVVKKITNILVYVDKVLAHPIGMASDNPEHPVRTFIHNSKSIVGLFRDYRTGRPYQDNLCFFRCFALHQGASIKALCKPTYELCSQWTDAPSSSFPGVTLEELCLVQDTYKVNIYVYSLITDDPVNEGATDEEIVEEYERRETGTEDTQLIDLENDDGLRGQLIQRSRGAYDSNLYLNLNNEHFSYIHNIDRYTLTYKCSKCDKLFNCRGNYMHHETSCTATIKHKFPGGGHNHNYHIFDRLANEGIVVEDRYYHYRASFDYKSLFQALDPDNEQLHFSNELIPASWSVSSNVPGISSKTGKPFAEPHCHISNGDTKSLVANMVEYLNEISDRSYTLMAQKYTDVLHRLGQEVHIFQCHSDRLQGLRQSRGPTADIEQAQRDIKASRKWVKLYEDFDLWLNQLPVLGFNSDKFDLNLVQRYLISDRGNNYMALGSTKLLFLDITNYLALGTSYDKWLKAFQIPQTKGIWPYEWFTDLSKLEEPLPPREAFYSTLRQEEISQEDYAYASHTWEEQGFQTMRDMLVWYNNLDVAPFLLAVDKMVEHWAYYGIDMFKMGCISVPGLAYKQMIQSLPSDIHLPIWSERSKEWYHKCKRDLVGGPSIIFHRYHEVGQTQIRGGKDIQSIAGFDANALYLYCTGQDMPTGCPGLWAIEEEGIKVPVMEEEVDVDTLISHNVSIRFERSLDFKGSSEVITWLEEQYKTICAQYPGRKLTLMHSINGGQKWFRIQGSHLYVDGFIPELGIILQYHGCRWLGHPCNLTRNCDSEEMARNRERTQRVKNLLETLGMTIAEETQCSFYQRQCVHPELRLYVQSRKLPLRNETIAGELVEAIRNGSLFGIAEVDIQVPWWVLGLRQKMAEMPPVFKNAEIELDDIGSHMKIHAESEGIRLPRRGLIGSYFAKSMVLTTPLLQWYLQNGLIITSIHGGAQFNPNPCFKTLTEEITNNRRQADQDSAKKVLGELSKLTGNSLYGKAITNKERHLNVTSARDMEASTKINSPLFRSLNLTEDNICEVHQAKGKVTFNLPSLVAFFVYGYAKRQMLDFYYTFLLPILGPENFQMIEMDTDSYYFGLSAPTLEEAVPNDRRAEYNQSK